MILAVVTLLFMAGAVPGRLEIPAAHPLENSTATGLLQLEQKSLSGLFYVPRTYHPNERLPLLILLHGGGRRPSDWFGSYSRRADAGRFIIVAPESYSQTWGSSANFGPDISRINSALAFVFSRYAIDRDRIIIGGVSDGASYALSLGLVNGDRIRGVIAFSPGFIVGREARGHPSFFISHGSRDPELPVGQTRVFVALLRSAGYSVDYHEFNGVHEVPSTISDAAMVWAAGIFKKKR